MQKKIKQQILIEIRNFRGDFLKKELREKVLKSLKEKGFKNEDENVICFNETYNELKEKNRFLYLNKESRKKFFIH